MVDRLTVPCRDGKSLEYRNAHVLVRDIGVTLDDGTKVTLDGIFGMNLLLPSAGGMGGGMLSEFAPSAFKRIWIDTPRQTLALELH